MPANLSGDSKVTLLENRLRGIGLGKIGRNDVDLDALSPTQFGRQFVQAISAAGDQHQIAFVGGK